MNQSKTRHFFQNAWRLAALVAILCATGVARAADGQQQPGRFLLIFETSPALKKNLPVVRQTLNGLLASNLQHEMQADDDLAVWTVDETLHTGTFPLESWSPGDAEAYSERLGDFLDHQKYTRHASLAAVQPLLNQVAKGSEGLTVLIFCDSQSRLAGTPYDSGVNDIITNAAARPNGAQSFYVLVLRSYHGEYLGCSVNRSGPLNFPKFPAPPAPEPPPVAIKTTPAPVVLPTAPVSGPVVTPVPALIIVGTNATTNVPALPSGQVIIKGVATPASPPPLTQTTSTASPMAPVTPTPAAPSAVTAPPVNPAPVSNPTPMPVPVPPLSQAPVPPSVSVAPTPVVAPASPPDATASAPTPPMAAATGATENAPADAGYFLPLLIGGGSLVVAVGLVIWLMVRTRRPHSSLITSSMQDDPRLPPRK